jgi:glutamate-1-semialdehyde 2,1-aminomutase
MQAILNKQKLDSQHKRALQSDHAAQHGLASPKGLASQQRPESSPELGLPADSAVTNSAAWFERAKRVLAGGISSSARATSLGSLPHPLYIAHGRGSRIWDADGNQFIDYLLSYGSTILGHGEAGLVDAVSSQLARGTMFGTCNTVEVELAEQICQMVPCAELVRFANSGSEAICGAVRAARGFTGRNKILKFEGHYHGWVDVLAVSNRPSAAEAGPIESPASRPHSRGTPAGVVEDVIIAPWNEPKLLKSILDRYVGDVAAMIAEPIVANNACTMPRDGYLEFLRDECARRDIVLIFDEIVTGFRIAPGGAQEALGVIPDIAVFSKALGGGLPISAFAGRRKIMEPIAANTVKHGGTYNGNPLCAAAALHTLRTLADPAMQQRMTGIGQSAMEAIVRSAKDRGVSCTVQGLGSMFQVIFGVDKPLAHYRDILNADTKKFAAFHWELLRRGIHINGGGSACWFVSAAHDSTDAQITAAAIEAAMHAIS